MEKIDVARGSMEGTRNEEERTGDMARMAVSRPKTGGASKPGYARSGKEIFNFSPKRKPEFQEFVKGLSTETSQHPKKLEISCRRGAGT